MVITKKHIEPEQIGLLAAKIKNKKELQEISDQFVREQLFNYFKCNPRLAKYLDQHKSSNYKQIIKEVRAKLRRVYGLFRESEDLKIRYELLSSLLEKKQLDFDIIKKILATHSSTRERLTFYDKLYQEIFKVTGKPRMIIDLGAGINPFSVPLMKLRHLEYYAYDLNEHEVSELNNFFEYLKKRNRSLRGKAQVLNILNFTKLPPAEVCFLFKMTDVLDQCRSHKTTENVVKIVPARFVVVSFPTKTMSGKKMNFPRRNWFELLCKRLGYSFNLIEFENEIFYVVKKK